MFKKFHTKLSLRFKKWSRKSYAAFKSIGRHVTIGSLKNVVADALLRKQKNVLSIFITSWKNNDEARDNEWDNPPEEGLLLELYSLTISQQKKFDNGHLKPQIIIKNYLWLKAVVINTFSFFIHPKPLRFYKPQGFILDKLIS